MWEKYILISTLLFSSTFTFNTYSKEKNSIDITFNEDLISATQNTSVSLKEKDVIIKSIIDSRPNGFAVYPSEGYYYFEFTNGGENIKGNFRFDVDLRNNGKVPFIYYKDLKHSSTKKNFDNYWVLDKSLGLDLKKIDNFNYIFSYKGSETKVKIYDAKEELISKKNLGQSEEYVGPVFDESGVRFHLIFDKKHNSFVYVLNDMFGHPETYSSTDSDNKIVIGTRSGFAYYNDKHHKRFILIGVSSRNVNENSYYDGPFDQLPDSFVDPLHLKNLIEKHEPRTIGMIGPYGNFLNEKDSRYSISPYISYQYKEELYKFLICTKFDHKRSNLNYCLTHDAKKNVEVTVN